MSLTETAGLLALLVLTLVLLGCGGETAATTPDSAAGPSVAVVDTGDGDAGGALNSVETIIADMEKAHEGRPHGVPESLDWVDEPRVNMGNDPGDFRAFTTWGQVYEDAEGNPAENTRVELRGMKAYVFSQQDRQWHLLQDAERIEGAAYVEDFADDEHKPADTLYTDDGTVTVKLEEGYNFHYWPASGRVRIDTLDIGGIFTTCQARLVIGDPNGPDDRDEARYLVGMGADYWQSLDADWDHFETNGDVGLGRHKYVRSEWRAFNMTSAPAELLRQHPPPLE